MTDNVQSAYKVHHFLVLYPYLLSQRFLFGRWLDLEQKAGVDSEGDAGLCAVVFIYMLILGSCMSIFISTMDGSITAATWWLGWESYVFRLLPRVTPSHFKTEPPQVQKVPSMNIVHKCWFSTCYISICA